MVAIIKNGYSLRRSFNYNQHKVDEGTAKCLQAANYPMDLEAMDSYHKLAVLERTAANLPSVNKNSVHITLNFSPEDKLSDERINKIATEYMQQIGFGEQPYLVFRHHDAAHPHLHIVTTQVTPKGGKVDINFIAERHSRPACVSLEEKYGLIKAKDRAMDFYELSKEKVIPSMYGKKETKRYIANVVTFVRENYKYTTLGEYNTLLNKYNVHADDGEAGSKLKEHKGLNYRMLNADGHMEGVPIKASLLYDSPTLKELEKEFRRNRFSKDVVRKQELLRGRVDLVVAGLHRPAIQELQQALRKQGIDLVTRFTNEGRLYGTTFIDHINKVVVNGSRLAANKAYNAASISKLCGIGSNYPIRPARTPGKITEELTPHHRYAPRLPQHDIRQVLSDLKASLRAFEQPETEELRFFYGGGPTWQASRKKKRRPAIAIMLS